jgi:amino acid transporter
VIGFLASFLALQTSASRVIWSYARDGALPGSHVLSRLSTGARLPTSAILVTTVIGAALFLLSNVATNIYTLMVNFTTGGFYLAFLFPLVGVLVVQLRGRWRPGPFTLGRLALPVSAVATLWALFEFLNISWPRPAYPQRFLDWSVWIVIAVLGVAGVGVFLSVRPRILDARLIEDEELQDELSDLAEGPR